MDFSQKLSDAKGSPFGNGFSFDELLKSMKEANI